ncbi:MAG: hypothetical protein HY000_25245 [Planctomycetes bacterium]|nr:hypothetical protein [Planctomycetota bacterium]
MIYRGQVRGGVVVLPPEVHLPDGTDVTVEPIPLAPSPSKPSDSFASMRNGVPVFPRRYGVAAVGMDLVNQLRD